MRPQKRVPANPSFFALQILSEATRPIMPEDSTDLSDSTSDPQAPYQPQGSLGWKQDFYYIAVSLIPVIRAKVVGGKEVVSGNDIYGNPIKRIQYEIKQLKMFKGPDKLIMAVFTAPSSAVCGVTLETNGKKEYLISGRVTGQYCPGACGLACKLPRAALSSDAIALRWLHSKAEGDEKMHVTLCDFIIPWESLSATQKKSLNQRYQMGCKCKISRCPSIPCMITAPDECLWTDWVTEKSINGRQAKHYSCIKRNDGSCAWYRGVAPPKKEFLDIEDP
ncbi:UNVERIFIED_CONTAM: hypothetical protein FKN15_024182 [Acipenser sinensis]